MTREKNIKERRRQRKNQKIFLIVALFQELNLVAAVDVFIHVF